ncbi:rod shape-determining protein MreC [Alphaproteobacteria bacterium]|nr:rod shape-determining protein MreC [Alphaproteobacteria bacterium]
MVSGKPSNNKTSKFGKINNIFLILLCLSLVFLGKLDLIAVRNLKAFMSDFLAPITFLFNKPVKEIASVLEDVKSVTSLREENIRFRSEIRRLNVWKSKTESQELELLELRELLKVIPKKNNQIITGRVFTAAGGVFANTVLINVGEKDGIVIGQPAISSLGLVGYVINVGISSSRILLIIDINAMIPIYLTDSNWPAVTQGQNGELLKIRFLSSEAKPLAGEVLETSGHGGQLPSGINVGRIVRSFSGNYYVKPTVNFQKLTYVSIITNFNSKYSSKNNFNGFAPLQKPMPTIGLKGINSSGTRNSESLKN